MQWLETFSSFLILNSYDIGLLMMTEAEPYYEFNAGPYELFVEKVLLNQSVSRAIYYVRLNFIQSQTITKNVDTV